jgi:chromate reductase, NAD(P)H dehydrogenase (quinone)
MKILAICGSLRALSVNAAILRACIRLAPDGINVTMLPSIGNLPLFSADFESATPESVRTMYEHVTSADALLIASPEYAHGITGAMKNALDWLVSFEPFVGKPVAVLNASLTSHHADDAMREVLTTMSARIIEAASVKVPVPSRHFLTEDIVAHVECANTLQMGLIAIERNHFSSSC